MTEMPKISVIIPVYNTGKYITKCLDSIIFQTYPNLEIICIDDGSTDKSIEIITEYSNNDNRIHLYRQEHNGTSAARNLGMEKSSGDYFSFIDSDDWIFLTLYQTFADTLAKIGRDIDIFMFNASSYIKGQNDTIPKKFFELTDWNSRADKYALYTFDDCQRPFSRNLSAANKIYRRKFLEENNITFPQNLKYEDQFFGIKSFLNAKSIIINDEIFYRYRNMTETSSTLEVTPKVFDIFKIIDLIEQEIYRLMMYESYKYALFQYKFNTYTSHYRYCPEDMRRMYFAEMKKRLIAGEKQSLDSRIYTKLRNYEIFEKVKNSSFEEFNSYMKSINRI